jgi:hypothetical protein
MRCPECDSMKITRDGFQALAVKNGKAFDIISVKCLDCRHEFDIKYRVPYLDRG